jgi:hypothetical protein
MVDPGAWDCWSVNNVPPGVGAAVPRSETSATPAGASLDVGGAWTGSVFVWAPGVKAAISRLRRSNFAAGIKPYVIELMLVSDLT